jgi:hypothetical protein
VSVGKSVHQIQQSYAFPKNDTCAIRQMNSLPLEGIMPANNFASFDLFMDSFNMPCKGPNEHISAEVEKSKSITGLLDNVEYITSTVTNHEPEQETFNFDSDTVSVSSSYLIEYATNGVNSRQEGEKCSSDCNGMYANSSLLTESVTDARKNIPEQKGGTMNASSSNVTESATDARIFQLLLDFTENRGFK